MAIYRTQHSQHQLLLGLLLFLISQFTLALHSHDFSLHTIDVDDCAVCLLSAAGDPAPAPATTSIDISIYRGLPLPNFNILLSQFQRALPQPRAPPIS